MMSARRLLIPDIKKTRDVIPLFFRHTNVTVGTETDMNWSLPNGTTPDTEYLELTVI